MKKLITTILSLFMFLCVGSTKVYVDAEGETASDLKPFLTDIRLTYDNDSDVKLEEDGKTYKVQKDKTYKVLLSFSEQKDLQFTDVMTYAFPTGFNVKDGFQGKFDITVTDGTNTYVVEDNAYVVSNNVLTVTFNKNDPEYEKLQAAANAKFSLTMSGEFGGKEIIQDWGGSATTKVEVNDPDLGISKDGWYDWNTHTIYYSVKVTSKGSNKNVVVTDKITGTALTFNNDVQASKGSVTASDSKGFTYTIPEMTNGETVEIKYTASVDKSKITDGATVEETNNGVTVKSDEDPEPASATKDFNNQINYNPLSKTVKSQLNKLEDGKFLADWTVTYGDGTFKLDAGTTITDKISDDSSAYMKYYGDVEVLFYDQNENVITTRTIDINDAQTTFNYPLPSDVGDVYKCVMNYQTLIDSSTFIENKWLRNNVEDDKGHHAGTSVEVKPNESNKIAVKKTVENFNDEEITWKVELSIPANGLSDAKVTDYLPNVRINNVQYFDAFKSLTVDGYTADDYTVIKEDSKVEIQCKESMLTGTGSARTITFHITTTNNKTWMENAVSEYDQKHINNVTFTSNNTSVSSQATVRMGDKITKGTLGTELINNLPAYKYYIDVFKKITGEFVVEDTYSTELFEPTNVCIQFNDIAGEWFDAVYQNNGVEVINTDSGSKFVVSQEKISELLAKKPDKEIGYARVTYQLKVKNAEALKKLNALAENDIDKKYTITNTANLDGGSSSANVDYEYEGISKNVVIKGDGTETPIAQYTIVANEDSLDMNSQGNTLKISDEFSNNQIIRVDSIQVKDGEGNTVVYKYDIVDNVMTFEIPDQKKIVITYEAQIVGNGDQQVTNTATIRGKSSRNTEQWVQVRTSGTGSASIQTIKLVKYEVGNMNKRLAGAAFALYTAEDNQPVKDKYDSPVSFVTDANGELIISGDYDKYGWTLWEGQQYYLQEFITPQGYLTSNQKIYFTVDDTKVNLSESIYPNGYTLRVSNTPATQYSLEKVWDDVNNQEQKRPTSLNVTLVGKVNDVEVSSKTYAISENDGWKVTSDVVPTKDDNGNVITYTWQEESVVGYTLSSSSTNGSHTVLTNTHTVENKGGLKISKAFVGETISSADKNAVSFTISGPNNYEHTISYASFKDGFYTLENLDEGEYTVTETTPTVTGKTVKIEVSNEGGIVNVSNGSTAEIKFTNTYEDQKGSLELTKNFAGDAISKESKDKITFTITGPNNYSKVVKYSEFVDGKYTLNGLVLGKYKVVESNEQVNGFEVAVTNQSSEVILVGDQITTVGITNTYYELTSVSGTKTWNDADNQDGVRPDSITVRLYADGQEVATTTANEETNWTYAFENLDKYSKGQEINYVVREDAVDNYSTSYDGTDIINTYTPEETSITIDKTWIDANDQDGVRPESIVVRLLANGQEVKEVTLTKESNWTTTISELPVYEDGKKITYTVEEDEVEGYTTEINGFNIINTHETSTTTITGTKTWNDRGRTSLRPESITVRLYADGQEVAKTTASEETNWTYAFNDVPEYNNGNKIEYSISEDEVLGYGTKIDGFDIINTRNPYTPFTPGMSAHINKVDENGKPLSGAVLELRDTNGNVITSWTTDETTFTYGQLISDTTYVLHEVSAPNGYQLAKDIEFEINSDDKEITISMEDKKQVTPRVPNTNDQNNLFVNGCIFVLSLSIAFFAFLRKKKSAN